ncbi:MAG: extracellular solute-binding protein [Candidatus Pacebacteria bacterium]|jgi:ABC-type glycerol-3-phosphate transport system substrate-binding protein|nr:extracellular solute-binding protein [Candidatus Paceibacterota bacterium]
MDKSPKPFQIAVTGFFVVLFILGFLGFSGKLPLPSSSKEVSYGEVTLWGSISRESMQSLLANNFRDEKSVSIKYEQKNATTFTRDFVEALASGKGPDLVILPQEELLKNLNKLAVIPYQTILERDFKNTFIAEGEMFLRPEGTVALPFMVDPIVMYWNRDIFTNALIAKPPVLWSEFYDLVPKITVRDRTGNITRSLVPFGEYRNVTNAKEILSVLLMQAGSPVVTSKNGNLTAALVIQGPLNVENPVVTAMRFYTEFSKSEKDSYSWNRSLPQSRSMFEAGDLALYFGYASEYQSIKLKNPHLNFDVAMIPQVGKTANKLTFGRMHGIAIVGASKNQGGALRAAMLLSGSSVITGISGITGLPPVRRDLIAIPPVDAAQSVFYDSALISRAWYDPSPIETNAIFMTMIDSVNSGRSSMNEALAVAHSSLAKLFQDYQQ